MPARGSFSDPRSRAAVILPQYANAVPKSRRVLRRPSHTFQLETRPFLLQPFMIAPVLPGETLKNMVMQARVVTDPIKHPLIGWWKEYYWFYVRHRDMPTLSQDAQDIMLNPSSSMYAENNANHATATTTYFYQYQGSVIWLEDAYKAIVQHYFRSPKDVAAGTWDDYAIDNLHPAGVNKDSWLDSVTDTTVLPDGGEVPEDAGNVTYEGFDRLMQTWQALRDAALIDMDYDDWLRTYGVNIPQAEQPGKPELIRYSRNWQYPSNTVNPSTGVPASAVSWAVAERADKDRYFKEPGFIIGVTCARPKVYFGAQKGYAAGMLNDAFSWLPALMQDHPEISLKEIADSASTATGGPLGAGMTNGYWVDVRDLFLYGDQFLNFALTETDSNLFALPTAGMQKKYPVSADLDALFNAASPANKVREDGVVSLSILGHQVDMT